MPNEKIEVGYRHIGTAAGVEYHHKFLLYTDKNSQQYTISGWTGNESTPQLPLGKIHIKINLPYDENNPDNINNKEAAWYKDESQNPISPQKQYRELIAQAPDLSAKWAEMVRNAQSKDNIYPYDYLRQNSNTLADTILREAGFPEPEKDGLSEHLAPGSGNRLDKNLIPKSPDNPNVSDIRHVISLGETILEEPLQTAESAQSKYEEVRAMVQGLLNDHDGSYSKQLLKKHKDVIDALEARVQQAIESDKQRQITADIETASQEITVAEMSFGGYSGGD